MICSVASGSESPPTSFGGLLRAFRQRANVTQVELAQHAGVSAKAIGALERGERLAPYPRTMRALGTALNLTEDEMTALRASVGQRPDAGAATGSRSADGPPDVSLTTVRGLASGDDHQRAAWELYIELVTRIAVVRLPPEKGLLRDALSSLYRLFNITRSILRQYGPSVLEPREGDGFSLGGLALVILNEEVRPFLVEWHPALLDHECGRPDGVSPAAHERDWERSAELREALSRLQVRLHDHAQQLAWAAGVRTARRPAGREP
jgi:transcriptional regulator with XRE-family HTH domain